MQRVWFSFVPTIVLISQAFAQTPTVNNSGVVNAASFAPGQSVAPGSLATIFGSQLASGLAQAASVPLSKSLADVQSVTFDNVPAPLVFVDDGQINVQVPWEVKSAGTSSVVVTRSTGSSTPVTVPMNAFSPGVFAVNFGVGPAIAINSDGSLAAPANSVQGIATHPARVGDTLLVLCTGLGPVDQQVPTGGLPSGLAHALTTPVVLIGGMSAEVQFAGLSPQFPGVNQINVVVPAGVAQGDAVPLQLRMGGITTTEQVTIAVSP